MAWFRGVIPSDMECGFLHRKVLPGTWVEAVTRGCRLGASHPCRRTSGVCYNRAFDFVSHKRNLRPLCELSNPCELCGKGNDGGLLPKCTTAPNQNTHLTWPTFTERERGQPTSLQNTECPLKPQWWGFLPKTMSSGFPPLPAGVWTWFSVWVPSNSDILWFHDFGIKLHWRKVVLSPCFGPWLEAVEVSSCHSTSHQLYCIVIIS